MSIAGAERAREGGRERERERDLRAALCRPLPPPPCGRVMCVFVYVRVSGFVWGRGAAQAPADA